MSGVCLADGSCADSTSVAYADASAGVAGECTKAAPCSKIADALGKKRAYVKLHGHFDEAVSIADQNVVILADPDTSITRTTVGVVVKIDGTSAVDIYDLAIIDGPGTNGIGLSLPAGNTASVSLHRALVKNNAGGGIVATGGTVNLDRCRVIGNTGGGITLSGSEYAISNSVIAANGSPSSSLGGLKIDVNTAGTHRLDFATITGNTAAATVNSGIACGTVLVPLTFSNSIVYGNTVSSGGRQLGGSANCVASYSDVGPDGLSGTGNVNTDPGFVDPLQGNYHLSATSPLRDAADPAATEPVDIDGNSRPQGARRDIGADEAQ